MELNYVEVSKIREAAAKLPPNQEYKIVKDYPFNYPQDVILAIISTAHRYRLNKVPMLVKSRR